MRTLRNVIGVTSLLFLSVAAYAQESKDERQHPPPTVGQAVQQVEKEKQSEEGKKQKEQQPPQQQQQRPEYQPQTPRRPEATERDRHPEKPFEQQLLEELTRRALPELHREPQRLSSERQRQMIAQQRQRTNDYDRYLQRQHSMHEQRSDALRRQNRMEQYRFHQEYLDQLREQERALRRSHDYEDDPYFSTAPSYRYRHGGRWYDVNVYAAEILQDAVNYGYQEGYLAGRADRQDRWQYDCEHSFAYEDANYGFTGYYVSQSEYKYFFRQGFRRGYEDGYYGRHRYGRDDDDGTIRIMSDVLRLILDLRVFD